MPTIIQKLETLQPDSGKRLANGVEGFWYYLQNKNKNPVLLVRNEMVSNASWEHVVKGGFESLAKPENRSATQKVMTLPTAGEDTYTRSLNTKLLGGRSYPVLTAVLGASAGVVSGTAGLIFSAATTALSLSKTSQRVLARGGDEIWQVEEIGKVRSGSSFVPVHVLSYFLVDPYRKDRRKAWLIHEERNEIAFDHNDKR